MRGVSGNLLPLRFVEQCLDAAPHARALTFDRFRRLWHHIEANCGPATGVRAITDIAAMPLLAELGFSASSASFTVRHARFQLRGTSAAEPAAPLALIVGAWANRSPATWREAIAHARDIGSRWCVIVAPPSIQIVDTRAHWSKQFIEFSLRDAAGDPESFARLTRLISPEGLLGDDDRSLTRVVVHARAFQDAVGADLQLGVARSLDTLSDHHLERHEALAIVYRVLFLLFVESRDLIPWRHPLYRPAYSIGTLCERARREPQAPGFWDGLGAVSRLLRSGCRTPRLDVPPFNGHLFARSSAPSLERRTSGRARSAKHDDAAIARTLLELSTRSSRHGRETIAYPDLGVEQLGAVYERVLGETNRKHSGTFYTPRALTEFVVREALAPLTHNASAEQILKLRVLDPSMGSGAFLVAACRHLAAAYERALVDEHQLSEHEIDDALQSDFRRLVAQRCLYGVDKNPTAVELARLSLWLATLARGKPLSFFDHRLRAGDALVGAGIDDIRYARDHRSRNNAPLPLLELTGAFETDVSPAVATLVSMAAHGDDELAAVRRKEAQWSRFVSEASPLHRWRLAADLWCARWFSDRAPLSARDLRAAIDGIVRHDATLPTAALTRWLQHAREQRDARGFFHWQLEFADVFFESDGRPRSDAGFDAIVGNPPWEMLRADTPVEGASRDERSGLVRFIRTSGAYRHSGRGHVNLYQPFLERALSLTRRGGRIGLVLPWGLATDDGAADLRAELLDRCATSSITGFDNKAGIFPVHRGVRFLALAATRGGETREMKLACGVTNTDDIEREGHRVSAEWLARVGGRTRRIPDVRSQDDAALLDRLTRRFPPVGSADSYGALFGRELNITDDKKRFSERGMPVIEGKHIQPFVVDALAARFRISSSMAAHALPRRPFDRPRLAYRDISAVGNKQALIAAIVPAGVVTTHTIFCLTTALPIEQQHFLCACFNSEVINRFVRLLMGGHLTTALVEGLPVPRWTGSKRQRAIATLAMHRNAGESAAPPEHPGARSTRCTRALAYLLAGEFEETY